MQNVAVANRREGLPPEIPTATRAVLDFIRTHGSVVDYPARATVFMAGFPADAAYAVDYGLVKIFSLGDEGESFTLALRFQGEPFALVDVLNHFPYHAHAETLTDTRVWRLSRSQLDTAVRRDHALTLQLLGFMSERMLQFQHLAKSMCLRDAQGRLAQLLLRLAYGIGTTSPDGSIRIELPLSQEEIGHLVGVTRSYTSTTLRGLTAAGVIAIDRRGLTILDPEAIAKFATQTEHRLVGTIPAPVSDGDDSTRSPRSVRQFPDPHGRFAHPTVE